MLCRFERANVTGLYSTAGFVELDNKTPADTAKLILQRLKSNGIDTRKVKRSTKSSVATEPITLVRQIIYRDSTLFSDGPMS